MTQPLDIRSNLWYKKEVFVALFKSGQKGRPLFSFVGPTAHCVGNGQLQKAGLIEQIEATVQPILASLGLDLVEVRYAGHGRRGILRIFIDREGGVTLEECEQAHRLLGHALDVADPIPHGYTLEVSSPGLDRPLRHGKDFIRHRGERARVHLLEPFEGKQEWVGEIQGVREETLVLDVSKERTLALPLTQVQYGKLLF